MIHVTEATVLALGFSCFIFFFFALPTAATALAGPAAVESAWTAEPLPVSAQPAEPALPRDVGAVRGFVNTCRKCQSHAGVGER